MRHSQASGLTQLISALSSQPGRLRSNWALSSVILYKPSIPEEY